MVSVERIYDILELPEEVDLTEDTHLLDNTKGQIVFENVSFGYIKDKLLMKNVNFTAKAEQMVAIHEEIIEAAKLAKCDSFIRKLPQGYDTR